MKVVQIAVAPESEYAYAIIFALCDDGSIRASIMKSNKEFETCVWRKLAPPTAELEEPPANGEQQANTSICPSCSGTGEIYGPSGGLESCFGCGGSGKQQ